VRRLVALTLLAALLLLGVHLAATWTAAPGPRASSGARTADAVEPAARLAGRADAVDREAPATESDGGTSRDTEVVRVRVAGPAGGPHAPEALRRLFPGQPPACAPEDAFQVAEIELTRGLASPAGVLLSGAAPEAGGYERTAPRIDVDTGTLDVWSQDPRRVEALYVYGGRIVARARLAPPESNLVVDPDLVFAGTGTLVLSCVWDDTPGAVTGVTVEIKAADREAYARAHVGGLAGAPSLPPLRLEGVPEGRYHVHADGIPWRVGAATVDVRAGTTTHATVSLARVASFSMRWFAPDGRPTGPRNGVPVTMRDAQDVLHEVVVQPTAGDPLLFEVRRVPPGTCWLVTPDHRSHRVETLAGTQGPVLEVHLEDPPDVVFAVHVEELPPRALAVRAPTSWAARDANGVTVATGTKPLTSVERGGVFRVWTNLPPGRYDVRWALTPDRVVERSVVVPSGVEWIEIDLDRDDG